MAILDATLIQSNSRPNRIKTIEEKIPEDKNIANRNKKDLNNLVIKTKESSDSDATWLKKENKYHFEFKSFAIIDEEGFIYKGSVANTTSPKFPLKKSKSITSR